MLTEDDRRGIPDLAALIRDKAEPAIQKPALFPCETPIRPDLNYQTLRYSDTAAHVNLHSNLPPSIMAFSQEPIPQVLSERTLSQHGPTSPFRHRETIRQWVEDIFVRNSNAHLVQYNTTVELAEKVGSEWVLTLRECAPGDTTNKWGQERFDSLVVATGHYNVPFIPDIPGLVEYEKRFPGSVRHTKHYGSADEFKNKVSS